MPTKKLTDLFERVPSAARVRVECFDADFRAWPCASQISAGKVGLYFIDSMADADETNGFLKELCHEHRGGEQAQSRWIK